MRSKFLAAAGAAALALTGTAADAAVTFQFSNVTFALPGGEAAGTLTGTFTTNDALSSITGFNITASATQSSVFIPSLSFSDAPATSLNSFFPFIGYTFTTANSTVTAATLPSQYFRINSTELFGPELQIYFASPLTVNGTTLNSSSSYEGELLAGNRFASGAIVNVAAAVPEPATWAMMMVGFALVAGTVRYRRRKSLVTYA